MNRIAFCILLAVCGCSHSYTITTDESGAKILTGWCTPDIFITDRDFHKWYQTNYAQYHVDSAAVHTIDSLSTDISFLIFLGTWCSDSKREVPCFFKVLDQAGISTKNIAVYGLDRSKKSSNGLTKQYYVTHVPTFIVFKGNKELGRIVELPQESLEKDLVKILAQQ